ncbi:MAG: aminomethyl-transferring glycine dehydrogenase subunit GcvPA [Pseudomonadota bacterium]|nr:aminomethyl-transferring glycine dehydrogenase subunit GcvPA [Pseudomonadota bacterium]
MRYLPHTDESRKDMLNAIGAKHIDELYTHVPSETLMSEPLSSLPSHMGEMQVESHIKALAEKNTPTSKLPSFLGGGCYHHHIPASVDHLIQRGEFLTTYTPYQPEVSQGTLTYVYEFQNYIARLTGMDIANASMYDGATAVTEAALMAKRLTKRSNVIVYPCVHPDYIDVLKSYSTHSNGTVELGTEPDENTACVIIQSPNYYGLVFDLKELREKCDAVGAKLVVAVTEIVSLGLLPAPEVADIVAGEAQSIGVPMSYGGPHLGFFACKKQYMRQMPGRLCGKTVDADGKEGFVLTLNTREQHIRRDKATSNICTNQGLCALAFSIHLSLLGETGFKTLAQLNHTQACKLADALESIDGVTLKTESFFNEVTASFPISTELLKDELSKHSIIGGIPVGKTLHSMVFCATELTTDEDIAKLKAAIETILSEHSTNGGLSHAV